MKTDRIPIVSCRSAVALQGAVVSVDDAGPVMGLAEVEESHMMNVLGRPVLHRGDRHQGRNATGRPCACPCPAARPGAGSLLPVCLEEAVRSGKQPPLPVRPWPSSQFPAVLASATAGVPALTAAASRRAGCRLSASCAGRRSATRITSWPARHSCTIRAAETVSGMGINLAVGSEIRVRIS